MGLVKQRLKIDDSLDVFAVHGVGGATGVLLTAIGADAALGGAGLAGERTMLAQLGVQVLGVLATVVWSALASYLIVMDAQPDRRLHAIEAIQRMLEARAPGDQARVIEGVAEPVALPAPRKAKRKARKSDQSVDPFG